MKRKGRNRRSKSRNKGIWNRRTC